MNLFIEIENSFKLWLSRIGYAAETVKTYHKRIKDFFSYLQDQEIHQLAAIQQEDLLNFKTHLETRPNKNNRQGLSAKYIEHHFAAINLLNQYTQLIGEEPFIKARINHIKGIDKDINILTEKQIKALYQMTDDSPFGYRDRAILSLYYGCGLRVKEGLQIQISDINYHKEILYIKAGKSKRSRYIPLNNRISKDLKDYLNYGRKHFIIEPENTFLISQRGKPLLSNTVNRRLKQLATEAQIQENVYAHLLRHSIATHLLKAGMNIENIGQFLGHNSLSSTEIYTHLSAE